MNRGDQGLGFPTSSKVQLVSTTNSGTTGNGSGVAGAAISVGNVVQAMTDGKLYPAVTTDFAAASASGASILVATALPFTSPTTNVVSGVAVGMGNNPVVEGTDGSLYFVYNGNATAQKGLTISRITPSGVTISTVTLDSTVATIQNVNVFFLSNGNLAIIVTNSTSAYYTILTPNLVSVWNYQSISSGVHICSIPLSAASGGGFAVAQMNGTTNMTVKIFDNGANLQATTSFTVSATPSASMAQLSNGNIVVAYVNTTITFAIISPSALTILGATSTGVTPVSNSTASTMIGAPLLSVMSSGFFAIAVQSSGGPYNVRVYSNYGVLQGSQYNLTANYAQTTVQVANFLNDGTYFWLVLVGTTTNFANQNILYVQISTLASATVYTGPGVSGVTHIWPVFDPTCNIITAAVVSGGVTTMVAFSTTLLTQVVSPTTIATSIASGNPCVITALSDGAFFAYGNGASVGQVSIWKSINSSILGVATSNTAVGATAYLDSTNGVKNITGLRGTKAITFNHASSAIYGNTGSLTTGGIMTLKGM